jgi:hypothetical protein
LEAEIRKIEVKGSPGEHSSDDPISKISRAKQTGDHLKW